MKLTHYLLAVIMLGACTTQVCLAKTSRPKANGSAGAALNAAGHQSSVANGPAVSAKSANGGKSEAGNPIEMAVPEPRRAPTNSKPMDWKKIGIVGVPPTMSQSRGVPALPGFSHRQNSGPGTGVGTHTIAPVSPGLTAAGPGGSAGARTALGATVSTRQVGATGVNVGRQGAAIAPAGRGQVPMAAGSLARNAVAAPAVGNSVTAAARINGPVLGRPMAASALPPATTVINRAVINGSTIARPASGPATVGGRATNAATAINGTGLRPKHP